MTTRIVAPSLVHATTGPLTFYLNTQTGNDLAGGLTELTAKLTWAAVWALVPDYRKHDVTINIGGSTPAQVVLTGTQDAGATLTLQGTNWDVLDDNGGNNYTPSRAWRNRVKLPGVGVTSGRFIEIVGTGVYYPIVRRDGDVLTYAYAGAGLTTSSVVRIARPRSGINFSDADPVHPVALSGPGTLKIDTLYSTWAHIHSNPYSSTGPDAILLSNCAIDSCGIYLGVGRVKLKNCVVTNLSLRKITHVDLVGVAVLEFLDIIDCNVHDMDIYCSNEGTGTAMFVSCRRSSSFDDNMTMRFYGTAVRMESSVSWLRQQCLLLNGATMLLDNTRLTIREGLNPPSYFLQGAEAAYSTDDVWSLLNNLKVEYNLHRVVTSGGEHGAADVTNIVLATSLDSGPSPSATFAAALVLANDLRTQYEAHRVLTAGGVHGAADTANVITAPVATDLQSLFLLANDLRTQYEAHRILIAGSVHGAADVVNVITTDAPAYDTGGFALHMIGGSSLQITGGQQPTVFAPSGDITTDGVAELAKWADIDANVIASDTSEMVTARREV